MIPGSRRIEIEPPEDTPEGMAEVIVLVTPAASAAPRPGAAAARAASRATIDEWRASHPDRLLSAEEIDTQLAEERASWGDDG